MQPHPMWQISHLQTSLSSTRQSLLSVSCVRQNQTANAEVRQTQMQTIREMPVFEEGKEMRQEETQNLLSPCQTHRPQPEKQTIWTEEKSEKKKRL